MTLSFFSGRKRAAQTAPHVEPARVGVNVTAAKGHRVVIDHGQDDAIPYVRYDAETAHIGKHLPNAGKDKPSMNLKAARYAAVLDRYADYLQGNGPTPDLIELVDACRFAAESMRDGIVIA